MLKLILGVTLAMTTAAPAAGDRVAFSSFGKVRIGLDLRALEKALQAPLASHSGGPDDEECRYVTAKTLPEGVSIMISHGRVVRIDVHAPGIATVSGAQVGMPERELRRLYPDQLADEPHKYAGPEGRYLTLRSSDGKRGIRFETDGQIVTGFHAGTAKSIEFVEGCQ